MAVQSIISPTYQPHRGVTDPRLPGGKWAAYGTVAGDLTGGNVDIYIRFFASTDPQNEIGFQIDAVNASRDDGLAENHQQIVTGWTFGGSKVARNTVQVPENRVAVGLRTASDANQWRPLFMGTHVTGTDADINLRWTTNTNTTGYRVAAFGVYWLADAASLPGGVIPLGGAVPDSGRLIGYSPFWEAVRSGEYAALVAGQLERAGARSRGVPVTDVYTGAPVPGFAPMIQTSRGPTPAVVLPMVVPSGSFIGPVLPPPGAATFIGPLPALPAPANRGAPVQGGGSSQLFPEELPGVNPIIAVPTQLTPAQLGLPPGDYGGWSYDELQRWAVTLQNRVLRGQTIV